MNKSRRYCVVKIAYRNGSAHEFNGAKKTSKIFDLATSMSGKPANAVKPKNAIGAQHAKFVNTNKAIFFATVISPRDACRATWRVSLPNEK